MASIYFIAFVDNKPVHFLSTLGAPRATHVSRVSKDIKGAYVGDFQLHIPAEVVVYNSIMGGTDLHDQKVSYYKSCVTGKRWQTRLFTHFLNSMIVNAHVLYKLVNRLFNRGDDCFTLLSFRQAVIKGWATPQIPVQTKVGGSLKRRVCTPGVHTPVVLVQRVECDPRRLCKQCKVKTNTLCQECGVHLCLPSGTGIHSCWSAYHTSLQDM